MMWMVIEASVDGSALETAVSVTYGGASWSGHAAE